MLMLDDEDEDEDEDGVDGGGSDGGGRWGEREGLSKKVDVKLQLNSSQFCLQKQSKNCSVKGRYRCLVRGSEQWMAALLALRRSGKQFWRFSSVLTSFSKFRFDLELLVDCRALMFDVQEWRTCD